VQGYHAERNASVSIHLVRLPNQADLCTSHLLGKKSWNVYNQENIERVRRDEARAEAEAIREERSKQDVESERRLAVLRSGQSEVTSGQGTGTSDQNTVSESAKQHRWPEDDDHSATSKPDHARRKPSGHNTSLRTFNDSSQSEAGGTRGSRNASSSTRDAGSESYNHGMRLSDAPGYGTSGHQPWYNTAPIEGKYPSVDIGKDVWGNEDPRRKEREQQRVDSNDPLAAMKRGVRQLRKAEADRDEWKAQRERDLNEVEELARKEHKHRRHRRRRSSDDESLENFDLDGDKATGRANSVKRHNRRHRDDHSHGHWHRRERSTSRYRRRSRSPRRRHK
jgi:hypothetical protein